MMWLIIIVSIVVVFGGILGGMGFFGSSDEPDRRGTGGNNFIDWML